MYYQHLKTRSEDLEFYAVCHGAKPSKEQSAPSMSPEKPNNLLFGDPQDYEIMSLEQKEEQTRLMKTKFKGLFDQTHIVPASGVGKTQKW